MVRVARAASRKGVRRGSYLCLQRVGGLLSCPRYSLVVMGNAAGPESRKRRARWINDHSLGVGSVPRENLAEEKLSWIGVKGYRPDVAGVALRPKRAGRVVLGERRSSS